MSFPWGGKLVKWLSTKNQLKLKSVLSVAIIKWCLIDISNEFVCLCFTLIWLIKKKFWAFGNTTGQYY